MDLPFGTIDGKRLEVRFSTADFSVATVIAGICEHLDMFEELGVVFLGVATDVPAGPQPVFQPAVGDIRIWISMMTIAMRKPGRSCLEPRTAGFRSQCPCLRFPMPGTP